MGIDCRRHNLTSTDRFWRLPSIPALYTIKLQSYTIVNIHINKTTMFQRPKGQLERQRSDQTVPVQICILLNYTINCCQYLDLFIHIYLNLWSRNICSLPIINYVGKSELSVIMWIFYIDDSFVQRIHCAFRFYPREHKKMCIALTQCWANVVDAVPTLYKFNVIQMFCA